jgi:hypothetical protein
VGARSVQVDDNHGGAPADERAGGLHEARTRKGRVAAEEVFVVFGIDAHDARYPLLYFGSSAQLKIVVPLGRRLEQEIVPKPATHKNQGDYFQDKTEELLGVL